MRTKHSMLNIAVGIGNQLVITALSFFSRTIFIHALGIDYLGVNGLFTSILAMLSLAEAGIGSSIVYSLYKPVAERDTAKINMLMSLYKRAYLVIAGAMLLLGLSALPFVPLIVKGVEIPNLSLIYLLFLANTVAPYLFQYKSSFLSVNQKTYIVSGIYSVSSILSTILKTVILYATHNYILYLIAEMAVTLGNSIILVKVANRMYPLLKEKCPLRVDAQTKSELTKNMKAIVLQNIGNYFVAGSQNMIISYFVSLAAVGLYSNYSMLIEIGRTLINQIFSNLYHSVGNLVAEESREKIYQVYRVMMFLNFWLYSLFGICLIIMIDPFITLWIGSSYLMERSVLWIVVLTFFERGMRNSITTVKSTSGIFHEDRYAPLVQAALNLALSLLLVRWMGLSGVFLGMLISTVLVPFWTTPCLVYRKVFQKPLHLYYRLYAKYTAVALGACAVTGYVCGLLGDGGIGLLLLKGIAAFFLPNALYAILFRRTEELDYLLAVAKRLRLAVWRTIKPASALPPMKRERGSL